MTKKMKMIIQEHDPDDSYKYMLLDRLRTDCNYYLGAGGEDERCLWSGSVKEQIEDMKRLYESFPNDRKPEWLTIEEIERYGEKMRKGFQKDREMIEEDLQRVTQQMIMEMQAVCPLPEESLSLEEIVSAYAVQLSLARSKKEYTDFLWQYAQLIHRRLMTLAETMQQDDESLCM